MTKDGEPFSPEEFEEMMKFGINPEDGKFHWKLYLTKAGVDITGKEKRKDSETSTRRASNKFK